MSNCCSKCKDICNCLNILSYDNSVLIEKDVCTGQCNIVLQVNPQFVVDNETPWVGNSVSLVITPGGVNGHAPNIEIVPSSDSGNIFDLGSDGKPFVPTPQVLNFIDTNTVDFTQTGNNIQAGVKIDPASTVPVTITSDGIRIDCCDLPDPLNFVDSLTVDFTQTGNDITAAIKIDPTSTAPVSVTPDGIKVDCCDSADITINNIPGISFTKNVIDNVVTFTPTFDWDYIASQVCTRCPAEPTCTPVTGLVVTNETVDTIDISWAANSSVSYTVRYREALGSTWTNLPPQTTTIATLTGLASGTSYLIEVINDCGGGLTSTTATVGTTEFANCPTITNLTVSVS